MIFRSFTFIGSQVESYNQPKGRMHECWSLLPIHYPPLTHPPFNLSQTLQQSTLFKTSNYNREALETQNTTLPCWTLSTKLQGPLDQTSTWLTKTIYYYYFLKGYLWKTCKVWHDHSTSPRFYFFKASSYVYIYIYLFLAGLGGLFL